MSQKGQHIQSLVSGLRENLIHYDIFDSFPSVHAFTTTRRFNDKLGISRMSPLDVSEYFGISENTLIRLGQIHSDKIYTGGVSGRHKGFDASVSKKNATYHSLATADCIPVFIYSHSDGQTALIHSGWRGTQKNIVGQALQTLINQGADVSKLYIAQGPSLRSCCYEVKEDVAQYFGEFTNKRDNKIFLNLNNAVTAQLLEKGVLPEHIEDQSECTACNPDIYFSYRYDKTKNRMISLFGVE